ncbi:MAG: hypothetical protein GY797_18145 [Deltaproteobacteria bacterium]|nr:hypothetical protein [Deltaproteobacteria bacterium]
MSNQPKDIEQMRDAILAFDRTMSKMTPALQQLGMAIQTLYDTIWQAYQDDGSPYGETDDGLRRWINAS